MVLTKATYSMIKGAPVNAVDFGVTGDGITNDSPFLQNAVNYCISNNVDLVIDGLCFLGQTVNIDRPVDNVNYDNIFTIYSQSGGGFLVNSNMPMFGSSLSYVSDPVTQLVRFENLIFELQDAITYTNAYVLDKNKFLRTYFTGCSFRRIKLLSATDPSNFIQSLYINNCNIRKWFGWFINATQGVFDFKFNNNICEAGDGCLNILSPVGCAITNNVIEGMSNGSINTAIQFNAAQSLLIAGNYFEGNSLYDVRDTSSGATGSKTVTIISNFFDPLTRTTPCVSWGDVTTSFAAGNYMKRATGTLHGITAGSYVNITDLSEGQNANAPSYTYIRDIYNASGLGITYGGIIRGTSVSGQGGKLILGLLTNNTPVECVNVDSSGNWSPVDDGIKSLGTSSYRWSVVYAATGTINTSDERTKQQIKSIDAKALRAWGRVQYVQYKFNNAVEQKNDGARWHFGLIAQKVKEAFELEGLNAFDYGLLCYDEWEAEKDSEGNEIKSAGNRYGIRYEEALALECAYLRSQLNQKV